MPIASLIVALLAAQPAAATPPAPVSAVREDRSLGLAGAPNFRDVGGYRTSDGRTVRRGLVYRSSKLALLTPVDWTRVQALRIGRVYDLRTVEERRAEPDNWPTPAPPAYESPKPDMAAALAKLKTAGSEPAAVRAAIRDFYAEMPTLYAPEYTAFFRGLASESGPALVHCTAGKDRTGVASALLLAALGVPRATILADYNLTERLLPQAPMRTARAAPVGGAGAAALLAMPAETQRAMWAADPTYVEAALDSVQQRFGSVDGYMREALGLTDVEIARLRKRLLS